MPITQHSPHVLQVHCMASLLTACIRLSYICLAFRANADLCSTNLNLVAYCLGSYPYLLITMTRQAALFVSHGAGPLPLLGNPRQTPIATFLKSAGTLLPQKPAAIVCVTGHWEAPVTTVSTHPTPPLYYDYPARMPDAAYQFEYKAPGAPELANRIVQQIRHAGIEVAIDAERGLDNGTFVPLMLMYPEADIPVVQVSVMDHLNPTQHIKVGQALAPLRDENILILGSGSSSHNMQGIMQQLLKNTPPEPDVQQSVKMFDDWLHQVCCELPASERVAQLQAWEQAPGARQAQPREDHFMPLLVVAGAAGEDAGVVVYSEPDPATWNDRMGFPMSSFLFKAST